MVNPLNDKEKQPMMDYQEQDMGSAACIRSTAHLDSSTMPQEPPYLFQPGPPIMNNNVSNTNHDYTQMVQQGNQQARISITIPTNQQSIQGPRTAPAMSSAMNSFSHGGRMNAHAGQNMIAGGYGGTYMGYPYMQAAVPYPAHGYTSGYSSQVPMYQQPNMGYYHGGHPMYMPPPPLQNVSSSLPNNPQPGIYNPNLGLEAASNNFDGRSSSTSGVSLREEASIQAMSSKQQQDNFEQS
jgi:hypothetical protein